MNWKSYGHVQNQRLSNYMKTKLSNVDSCKDFLYMDELSRMKGIYCQHTKTIQMGFILCFRDKAFLEGEGMLWNSSQYKGSLVYINNRLT